MCRSRRIYIPLLERIIAPSLGIIELTHDDGLFASCDAVDDSSGRAATRGFCRNVSRSCVILEIDIFRLERRPFAAVATAIEVPRGCDAVRYGGRAIPPRVGGIVPNRV